MMIERLKILLEEMQSVAIAYSGGLDSTFLLKIASDVLKDRVLAVTAVSASRPAEEIENARVMARQLGVRHEMIETDELSDPHVRFNHRERCYFCKKRLLTVLLDLTGPLGFRFVADGSTADDLKVYRPGNRAVKELGIRSPLMEAGITKAEVRAYSRRLGLKTWNQSSQSCLLTRFPYEQRIDEEDLAKVARAETILLEMGFKEVRVRIHGSLARLELGAVETRIALEEKNAKDIILKIKALGYDHVTLDLEGFRSGSWDQVQNGTVTTQKNS